MLISFEKPTYLGLIPIGYAISLITRNLIHSQLIRPYYPGINSTLLTILMMIGEMVGGLLIFLKKITTKGKTALLPASISIKDNAIETSGAVNKHFFSRVQNVPKHRKNIVITYIIILLIALFDISGMYFKNYFVHQDHTYYDFILLELIHAFNAILCYFILKIKLFRHHNFSILLVFVGYFLVNAIELTKIPIDIIVLIEGVIIGFAFSVLEILSKYIMDSKYINPYRLLFFQGLFGITLLAIICGIIKIIIIYNSNMSVINGISNEFDNVVVLFNDAGTFFVCFAYIFLCACVNIGVVLTIYYYNPISRSMVDCNTVFFSWLTEMIKGVIHQAEYVGMEVVGFALMAVGGLVYHEITILRFFRLEKYTKREISKRGYEDREQAIDELRKVELIDVDNPTSTEN